MWSLELTFLLIRFVAAVFFSLIVGIFVSTFLGVLAWHGGYNAELVFNVSGVLATLLAFLGCWQMKEQPQRR